MNLLKQQQIKKPSDRQQLRRGHRAYAVPEVASRGPLVWLGDEDPCKICDAMDGKVDGEGWSSLRGPQWWVNAFGRWESLGKGRISGVPPVHPNCQCRLVSMREWLDVRRAELGRPGEFTVEVESVEYFKSQRESILKEVRAQREMAQLAQKKAEKERREEKKRIEKRKEVERLLEEQSLAYWKMMEQNKQLLTEFVNGVKSELIFVLSAIVDGIPFAGSSKAATEVSTGIDPITGYEANKIESGIGLMMGSGPMAPMRTVRKATGRILYLADRVTGRFASRYLSEFGDVVSREARSLTDKVVDNASKHTNNFWAKLSASRRVDLWERSLSLELEETMKSHVLSKHVGKTEKELLARGKKNATTFRTQAEAEACIKRVIRENKNEIVQWVKGKKTKTSYAKNFTYKFKEPVGWGVDGAGNKLENLRTVKVRIHEREGEFKLITAFLEQ